MKRLSLATMLLLLILSAPSRADDQEELKKLIAQMDAQPQKVISFCDAYKADPYGKNAPTIGAMLLTYADKSDKVNINVKDYVVAPLLTKDPDETQKRILTLYLTGLISYALKNGGRAGDDDVSNLSALQNIADGYANMLKTQPEKTNAFAAQMVKLSQQKGGLQSYLTDARKKAEASPSK